MPGRVRMCVCACVRARLYIFGVISYTSLVTSLLKKKIPYMNQCLTTPQQKKNKNKKIKIKNKK